MKFCSVACPFPPECREFGTPCGPLQVQPQPLASLTAHGAGAVFCDMVGVEPAMSGVVPSMLPEMLNVAPRLSGVVPILGVNTCREILVTPADTCRDFC